MVCKPHLNEAPENLGVLELAAVLLPSQEYGTVLTNFPGTNAGGGDWSEYGKFYLDVEVYQDGEWVGGASTGWCDETGVLEVNFDEIASLTHREIGGLVLVEVRHGKNIPQHVYFSVFHRASGGYVSAPALPFMGNDLFPDLYSRALDNTLFWPGAILNEYQESLVAIMNPYNVSYSYQMSLFLPEGRRCQAEAKKLGPKEVRFVNVREVFPEEERSFEDSGGRCAVCVAAQFRAICYGIVRDRKSKIINSLDHFHVYLL